MSYSLDPNRKMPWMVVDMISPEGMEGVYAGTYDPRKGGVLAAVAAGQYLDDKYHIHIIGFGDEQDEKL